MVSVCRPHPTSAWRWLCQSHGKTWPCLWAQARWIKICKHSNIPWTTKTHTHWIFQDTQRAKHFLFGDVLSPCGNWDFRQGSQHHGLLQANKGHEGRVQEVHLPHQHIWCLRVSRQLLHELVPQLWEPTREETLNVRFTPARFPVVIKQSIFKGNAAIQVKYQTRRPWSTQSCCISFLSWGCQDGDEAPAGPLVVNL